MSNKQNIVKSDGLLQFDSSNEPIGRSNVMEAISVENDVIFNESYIVIGKKLKAENIHATYNLTIIGNVEANTLLVNGDLVVDGDIRVKNLQCLKHIVCSGKIQVDSIKCDGDIYAKKIDTSEIESMGSVLVSTSIDSEKKCKIERNLIVGEGISGSGMFEVENAIASDYFDFDGESKGNIFEISTMFMNRDETKVDDKEDFNTKFNKMLNDYMNNLCEDEEDVISDSLRKCAEIQQTSFEELHYLFEEIVRISYLDDITNLRDYIIVEYADRVFSVELKGYETIEHVFTLLNKKVVRNQLEYKANRLIDFVFSLKAIQYCFEDSADEMADKVFSYVGIRYKIVKRQFEEA